MLPCLAQIGLVDVFLCFQPQYIIRLFRSAARGREQESNNILFLQVACRNCQYTCQKIIAEQFSRKAKLDLCVHPGVGLKWNFYWRPMAAFSPPPDKSSLFFLLSLVEQPGLLDKFN